MPICTQCPHSTDIQAGKYATYEAAPCSRCREFITPQERRNGFQRWTGAGLPPGKGRSHIDIDLLVQKEGDQEYTAHALRDATESATHHRPTRESGELAQAVEAAAETFSSGTAGQVEAFMAFLRRWLTLPAVQRDAVAVFLVDPQAQYKDVAQVRGCSVQAVHASLRTAKAKLPILRVALAHKAQKRDAGAC
jgi:hypothetical protein